MSGPRDEKALKYPIRVLCGSAAVWTAADVAHLAHYSATTAGFAGAAITGVTYMTISRRGGKKRSADQAERAHRSATQAALATFLAGAWATAAVKLGPLAGPDWAMSLAWLGGTVIGVVALNFHAAVKAARDWRRAKAWWRDFSYHIGLDGSFLLEHTITRLGEHFRVDIRDTGRVATAIASGGLEEVIAQELSTPLPKTRVRVTPYHVSGQIEVSIRYDDPWAAPILHPLLDKDPEIHLKVPCSIKDPLIIGQDPETGKPLPLTVWTKQGGRAIYIVAKREGGKTTLLDSVRERVTACRDALVFDINVSKAAEDWEWGPAMHLSAVGFDEHYRALAILELACQLINLHAFMHGDDRVYQPTARTPAIVVIVDEIDELVKIPGAKERLQYIASKARSESVILIGAGQRATAAWMGGSNVRTQLDAICIGKVASAGEVRHALGDQGRLFVPDMTSYGEGHPGVWTIAEDTIYHLGRSFYWTDELTSIRKIAWERRAWGPDLPKELKDQLGDMYATLRRDHLATFGDQDISGRTPPPAGVPTTPVTGDAPGGVATMALPTTGVDMARDIENAFSDLPQDLRDRLGGTAFKISGNAQRLNDLGEVPDIPQDQLDKITKDAWHQLAEQTVIPVQHRAELLSLLSGEGTTIAALREALGVKEWTARKYLNHMRDQGWVEVQGEKRGARWVIISRPPDGWERDSR